MPSVVRTFLSLPAAMFYCMAASGWSTVMGGSNWVMASITLVSPLFLAGSVALWVLGDARQHRRNIPYDFASFVFFTWPVFVPLYLLATRGWRAVIPLGWFLLLYVAAASVGNIPLFLRVLRR